MVDVNNMLRVSGSRVYHGKRMLKECASERDAELYRRRVFEQLLAQRAAMIDPDDKPGMLAGAVDSCVDTAIMLINENDAATLPPWAQQVCALVVAADSAIDELLQVMGVNDPDENDSDS